MTEENTEVTKQEPNLLQSRLKLIFLFGLFFLPVFGAMLLFQKAQDGLSWGTVNNGELIRPARPINQFILPKLPSGELKKDYLQGKWSMVYFASPNCDEVCMSNIYHMRQLRVALGRDMDRMQHLLVLNNQQQADQLQTFLKDYANMQLAFNDTSFHQQFKTNIPPEAQPIYLVDPLGNLMMAFPAHLNPQLILKDIKKLLKISKIG